MNELQFIKLLEESHPTSILMKDSKYLFRYNFPPDCNLEGKLYMPAPHPDVPITMTVLKREELEEYVQLRSGLYIKAEHAGKINLLGDFPDSMHDEYGIYDANDADEENFSFN